MATLTVKTEYIGARANENVELGEHGKKFKDFFPHLDISGRVSKVGEHAVSLEGGFADVWKGIYHSDNGDQDVAIKALRCALVPHATQEEQETIIRRLYREFKTWASTDHPNVLPLLGYSTDLKINQFAALISPWQDKGTARQYLEDKGYDVRLQIVIGASKGLEYLHIECKVVHGDFRGANILISKEGVPLLSDFGLSRILSHSNSMRTERSAPGGCLGWMAPELIEQKDGINEGTQASDVWSCGMTMMELITCAHPFNKSHTAGILLAIVQRKLPPFPEEFPTELRPVCLECVNFEADKRPTIDHVVNVLKDIASNDAEAGLCMDAKPE